VFLLENEKDNNMTNNIKTIEDKFVNAMGSGVAASGHLLTLMVNTAQSEDGRNLASAIARLNKKQDKQGSNAVRQVIASVFVGAKIKKAKDNKTILLSLKDANLNQEAMQRLSDGVKKGLSLRSTLAKTVKGETAKPKEVTASSIAVPAAKKAVKANIKKAQYMATMEAAFDAEMKERLAK